ncbi:hypothetical protein HYX06_05800 [Candidatus Woesearchaeota archaeon]|nr:hypothetical protein [Candidatus Woesearchaeota archaeon]
MKNKKADTAMWFILVGAIIAIVIGGIYLYVIKGGLSVGEKNVGYLSSCGNQKGVCRTTDTNSDSETCFFKAGCPYDENGDGKTDESEKAKGNHCCIPKET